MATPRLLSVLLFALLPLAPSQAALIDFEGLGLLEGSPVPVIDGVVFDGEIALQGLPQFAFFSDVGIDTGDAAPFNATGNTFIVNDGGYASPSATKTVTIEFPTIVTDLNLLVVDVDSIPQNGVQEQLKAEAFNSANESIGTILVTAPLTGDLGDADVVLVDFGSLTGIKSLVVEVTNIGTNSGHTDIGFGLDNLAFNPIPEPSTLVLLSIGLIAAMAFGWRRRAK